MKLTSYILYIPTYLFQPDDYPVINWSSSYYIPIYVSLNMLVQMGVYIEGENWRKYEVCSIRIYADH